MTQQIITPLSAQAQKWKALSRKNEDRLKASNAERDAAQDDAMRWKRRAQYNLALLSELRRQNADLLDRLAGQEVTR